MIKNVPVPFAPFVMTNGGSNALKDPVIERIIFKVKIVFILGKIIWKMRKLLCRGWHNGFFE